MKDIKLGDLLDELAKLPRDMTVQRATLRMKTSMGNHLEYRYPSDVMRQVHTRGLLDMSIPPGNQSGV